MTVNDIHPAVTAEAPGPLMARALLACAVLLSVTVLLFWQMSEQTQRSWQGSHTVDVSLAGERYRLNPGDLQWLQTFSMAHFSGDADEARRIVAEQVNVQLNETFEGVSARLPLFADWYYSLRGEYSRLSMAVLSSLDLADGDFVARRAAAILFPDQVWTTTLTRLDIRTTDLLQAHHAQSRKEWLAQLQQQLSAQKVPAPIPGLANSASPPELLVLDSLAGRLQALEAQAMFGTRTALSSLGAAGVAGPALWRAVAARSAANSARAAATAGAARGASRAAAHTGSAAAGAAVCLPGGPIALACAAVAGVATWLATDWLLLQVDEALNREELLAELEAGLRDLRAGLEQELLRAYDERIALWQQATLVEIQDGFSPAAR